MVSSSPSSARRTAATVPTAVTIPVNMDPDPGPEECPIPTTCAPPPARVSPAPVKPRAAPGLQGCYRHPTTVGSGPDSSDQPARQRGERQPGGLHPQPAAS